MPKFAANISLLFTEFPFMERFAAAAEARFEAVEILFPYDQPAQDILNELVRHELHLTLINCPPPNYTGGAPGYAADPKQAGRFRRDFARTMRYAQLLKPQHIHIMSGPAEGPEARKTFVNNLRWASAEAPRQSLTIEPINQQDQPGYFLCDFDEAARILDEVAAPNVNLQYDAYHAQMITGDALSVWEKHGHRAHHVQVGSVPGRHEPMDCDIDYPELFARMEAAGYTGWVSGEYHPKGRTEDGLGWTR